MLFLKYLLLITGSGLLAGALGILGYDLYLILRKREEEVVIPFPRWRTARKLALLAIAPLLVSMSIAVVPPGFAAVRVSQFSGAAKDALPPGVHLVLPLIQHLETFSSRDNIYAKDTKVQTKEGLEVGVVLSVRFRLDPAKLDYIYTNLPQPVETEMVPPVVSTVLRELAPNYQVRELFATKRDEIRRLAAERITQRLGVDGIQVKEVMLRDITLPEQFAKSMEGVLLKEQENDRYSIELEVKAKQVRAAELEADAAKVRDVKQAEGQAQITVLQAKAQSDAMQYTLPLKEKQIQQTRLESEARKEATVKNAEALAMAKVIDSKAELEKRKLTTEGDQDRIRRTAVADSERMKLEADVLKTSPLLIQKIIAERLSDKIQIMMVPSDGKFFFSNDVMKGMTPAATRTEPQ